jgi:hypothetical protein
MKRSGNVGLVLMGGAVFAATFAAGTAYFAWQRPSHAAEATKAETCTARPDGTQTCEPTRRGFAYYLLPRSSWSWGWGTSYEPRRQEAALTNSSRSYVPTTSTVPAGAVVERSGFGSSAKGSFRVSAGG